ncbi:MAG: hypothetical protein KF878_16530 [Planctomycetes bacterium]|nr:hypothetical protein [Planctomycetota bacterium]
MPRAEVLLDGVTYLAVERAPVVRHVDVDDPPSPTAAERALASALAGLTGADARLRAGFAAVRFADDGPTYLFSFQAREVGGFEVTYAGEDPSPGGASPPSDGG